MKTSLHKAFTSILALVILGHASTASAQFFASSSFDSLTQNIVDLNPDDGVAAGLCVTSESAGAFILVSNDSGDLQQSESADGAGGVTILIDTADAYLASRATPTSASSQVRIDNGRADASTDGFINFLLAPYTEVTFSIAVTALATQVNLPGAYAFSFVGMNGWTRSKDGTSFLDTDGLSSYIAPAAILSVTLRSAADPLDGTLEVGTGAVALMPAVPEPASMAMLAAGLALMVGRKPRTWTRRA